MPKDVHLHQFGDRWRLFVVVDELGSWPEHDFPEGGPVPTVHERSRALNAMGYALTDETDWTWLEVSASSVDKTAVRLIATAEVQEVPE